tara:strand:- start:922 stop:1221 length:300 start_codon:yes stop_codon:yes gene_type:complete
MDRYQATKMHKTGKRCYKTTIIPKIPTQSTDLFIISREGDRLDLLANEFYQDVSLWWVIAEANQVGKGTTVVPAGIQMRIPNPITRDILDLIYKAEEER